MTASRAVTVVRTFRARPERVFAAFEDPAELAKWMRQPGSEAEVQSLDVREGGSLVVQMTWGSGMSIRLYGTFTKVKRPSLLEFTWAIEGNDANSGVVTVEFESHGSGTELTLTHEGLTGPALAQSKSGWNGWFDRLERLIDPGADR